MATASRTRSSACTWSWAARRRSWSSTTPTSRPPCTARSPARSSTPARTAPRPPARTSSGRCTTPSSPRVADLMAGVRLGDSVDPATDLGPLVSHAAAGAGRRVRRTGTRGGRQGRQRRRGSRRRARRTAPTTCPRWSSTPPRTSEIVQDEIFGPVLVVLPFDVRRRGPRARQRHAVRPGRVGLDPRRLPRHARDPRDPGGLRLGQRPHPDHQRDAARRLQGRPASARTCRTYSFDEYTQVKHVMYDITAVGPEGLAPHHLRDLTSRPHPRTDHEEHLLMAKRTELPRDPKVQQLIRLRRAQLSRRSLLRGPAAVGAAALLSACGTSGGGRERRPAPAAAAAPRAGARARPTPTPDTDGPPPTSRSAGPTGPSTSTATTTGRPTPRSRSSWSRPASRSPTPRTSTTTTPTIGKIRSAARARPGHRRGHHRAHRLDGRPADPAAATCRSSTRRNIPQRAPTSVPSCRSVDWDPGRAVLATPGRAGSASSRYNKERSPDDLKTVSDLLAARPQGPGRGAHRDARHDRPDPARAGHGHLRRLHRGRLHERASRSCRSRSTRARSARSRATPTRRTSTSGDALAVIGWSGDIFQLNVEKRRHRASPSRSPAARYWSDNLHGPDRRHRTRRTPRSSSTTTTTPRSRPQVAAYVNYVCPVEGAQAEMEKIDPTWPSSPLIFPTRRGPQDRHGLPDADTRRGDWPTSEAFADG